ncbi:unnamed protein product [Litomosoides sigmodontis]|uniref:Uncharacterized protein n=1 Tax=Litomosoides sigmodontis TaxID=42156 RepID=A0A3P6U6H2_LITSI|nr:unnamed protein product [Litomosoides sigmodontis]
MSFYRKKTVPATFASQHDIVNSLQSFSSNDDQPANAKCHVLLRRKRFTRRQRHNLTGRAFGNRTSKSTSTLNKVEKSGSTTNSASSSSSTDTDSTNSRRKRSIQLARVGRKSVECKKGATTEVAFHSFKQNYANSNLITQSTTPPVIPSVESIDSFQKFKGPAARKAHRRTQRSKLNSFANKQLETKAESQAGLNIDSEKKQLAKDAFVRRSASVRDLNGTMIDFTNQDSVTRWTSQILAEIDSLPSSSFDLTGRSTPRPLSPLITTTDNSVITTDNAAITNVAFLDELADAPLMDSWQQKATIPETSCTAHIALKAQPSNCRTQSAHAILTNSTKNSEHLNKFYFLQAKIHSANDSKNLEILKSEKSDSKDASQLTRNDELELKRSIAPTVKRNVALALDAKPSSQCFTQMPKLNPEQRSGHSVQQESAVEQKASISSDNDANERMNRTNFSLECINLIKESNVDDRLKLFGGLKRTELADQTSSSSSSSSPLAVWKRKNEKSEIITLALARLL